MKTIIIHFNNGFRVSAKDLSYMSAMIKINNLFQSYTLNKTYLSHVDYR